MQTRKMKKIEFIDKAEDISQIFDEKSITFISLNILANLFSVFLKENMSNLKSEYFIPSVVNNLITKNMVSVRVYSTQAEWFGITYPEDRPIVVKKLGDLTEKGEYPTTLF